MKFEVDGAGNVKANSYNPLSSSLGLKENVAPIGADEALALLAQLQPVSFAFKTEPDRRRFGFIAEQLPPAMSWGGRGIDLLDMTGFLTRMIKAQQEAITEITLRLRALEERIAP